MRNLKLAFRTLARTPFVTAVAILSLALGIGANAAIFSLFETMLLRPLPVRDPGSLVNLAAPGPKPGSQSCNQAGDCETVFSHPMLRDLQAAETGLEGIAGHFLIGVNLGYEGQTRSADGVLVSGSYFPLLGLRPALGRLLGPADDATVGAHPVAVLSHRYWRAQLGSDPGVVGRTLVVNGHPMEVVGVAPEGFDGTTLGATPAVFVPLSMRGVLNPGFEGFDDRRSYWVYLFGRLRPGTGIEQARAALQAAYRPIVVDVEAPLQEGMSEPTMARFLAREIVVEPGARGQSSVHEEAATPLRLLLAVTAIVLLIACANIANLLLARGANRGMEMAIRLSLGAHRRQVVAQLLVESCLLALLGGLASLLVAHWTMAFVSSLLPPEGAASLDLRLRPGVLLFTGALALGTGLLFGLFPALHSTRSDLVSSIRANAGQIAGARTAARFRTTLVTAQVALSMTLLVVAGLFLRSLGNVARVDLGVQVEQVVTFGVTPGRNGYDVARTQLLARRVEEELAALPGVTAVAASTIPLLAGSNRGTDVAVEGFEGGPDVDANARLNAVSAGYFAALGVPLLAGREFGPGDVEGAGRVAVVNETFARKFGLGRDAVGRWMSDDPRADSLDIRIVGVTRDAKYSQVKDTVPPLFFTPYAQEAQLRGLFFYVRASGDPQALLRAVPAAMARIDPNLPVEELKTMTQQVRENVFLDRTIGILSSAFALLATLLAAVGLYGVLAYTVAQRTREIGVRMALGADAGRVRALVLRQVGWMVLIGGAAGALAALGIGRAAGALLYGLGGADPLVMASAAALLAGVALGAGYLPARRAAGLDPVRALRYE